MRFCLMLFLLVSCYNKPQASGHTFWVIPSAEQDCEDRINCNTLEEYYKQNKSIFSTANSAWIFLEGNHFLYKSSLHVNQTENVTFEAYSDNKVAIFRQGNQISIENSANVSFHGLNFKDNSTKPPQQINFKYVKNVTLSNLIIDIPLLIESPFGRYDIHNCAFNEVINVRKCSQCPQTAESDVNITFSDTSFHETGIHLDHSDNNKVKQYDSIVLHLHKCNFIKGSIANINIEVKRSFPRRSFIVMITECTFKSVKSDVTSSSIHMKVPIHRNHMYDTTNTELAKVMIEKCTFLETLNAIQLSYNYEKFDLFLVVPTVTISETQFHLKCNSSELYEYGPILKAHFNQFHDRALANSYDNNFKLPLPILTVKKCKFATITSAKGSVIQIVNFKDYPVKMIDNEIFHVGFTGIEVINSSIWLSGTNYISYSRSIDASGVVGNGLVISFLSLIFLENGTVLVIDQPSGYGIEVPQDYYRGSAQKYIGCIRGELQDENCNGNCFFQLIQMNGKLLNNNEDIFRFTGSIKLKGDNNTLYNGRLHNCKLQSQKRSLTLNSSLSDRVLPFPASRGSLATTSMAYNICLCDMRAPTNTKLWDCGLQSTIRVYPGQYVNLSIILIGDEGNPLSDKEVNITSSKWSQSKIVTVTIKNTCNNVYNEGPYQAKDATTITLQSFVKHTVEVLTRPCPPGFKVEQEIKSNTSKCECNDILHNHGFQCSLNGTRANFRNDRSGYWIGLCNDNKTLICFTDSCPPFYCKKSEFMFNILNQNLQCNHENRRKGFICSECPEGFSSIFGEHQCLDCKGMWYLTILLYACAGLAIVCLLLLFNLTVMHGAINGICLYANIMYLYYTYLEENTVHSTHTEIALSLLRVLNLEFGRRLCLYDGMDEFTKILIRLFFQFYFIIIVTIVVVITYKCKFNFLKRTGNVLKRTVPVLATVMLITYTNITGIVISALRHISVHKVEQEGSLDMWYSQPTLQYFHGRHLALACVSLNVCILYLLPVTIMILCGNKIRRYTNNVTFGLFLDVFHGPYKPGFGFWQGLRLILRLIILVLLVNLPIDIFILVATIVMFVFFSIQLVLRPFIEIRPFSDIDSEEEGRKYSKRLAYIARILVQPLTSDSVYFANFIVFSFLLNIKMGARFNAVIITISIVLAILQLGIITVYHGAVYFPMSKPSRLIQRRAPRQEQGSFGQASNRSREGSTASNQVNFRHSTSSDRQLLASAYIKEENTSFEHEEELSTHNQDRQPVAQQVPCTIEGHVLLDEEVAVENHSQLPNLKEPLLKTSAF